MRKLGWWTAIVVLVVLNGVMFWRVQTLDRALRAVTGDEAYLTILDGSLTDLRGFYTYPTFGRFFMPEESLTTKTSMSMVVFLTSKINCPWNAMELERFKDLLPLFTDRGQRMVAVCAPPDSAAVAHTLDSIGLSIPLTPGESEQYSFSQMGISPDFMPFKVLYDSNYTAIYMRGGDSSPQSQQDFIAAARRLSTLAWGGQL